MTLEKLGRGSEKGFTKVAFDLVKFKGERPRIVESCFYSRMKQKHENRFPGFLSTNFPVVLYLGLYKGVGERWRRQKPLSRQRSRANRAFCAGVPWRVST
jgi:hypothetical protein